MSGGHGGGHGGSHGVGGVGHGHGAGAVHGHGGHAPGTKKASVNHQTGQIHGSPHPQCKSPAQVPPTPAGQKFLSTIAQHQSSAGFWSFSFSRMMGIAVGADKPDQLPTIVVAIGDDMNVAYVFGKDETYSWKGQNHGQAKKLDHAQSPQPSHHAHAPQHAPHGGGHGHSHAHGAGHAGKGGHGGHGGHGGGGKH